MLKEYKRNLIDLGLSEKEATVYLVLLNEGTGTADIVAKHAALNRSTTYVQIEALMERGLVSTFKKGKKTLFSAESPNNLQRFLEQKESQLNSQKIAIKNILPELLQAYSSTGERPVIRTYEGKAGLMTMRNEVINSGCKELYAAFSFDDLYKIFTVDELMAFSNARAKKKMISYVLYNKEGENAITVAPQELRRLPKKDYPFSSDIYIYGNSVSIASTSGNIFAVTISHKTISDTMLSLFKLAWEKAAKQ